MKQILSQDLLQVDSEHVLYKLSIITVLVDIFVSFVHLLCVGHLVDMHLQVFPIYTQFMSFISRTIFQYLLDIPLQRQFHPILEQNDLE